MLLTSSQVLCLTLQLKAVRMFIDDNFDDQFVDKELNMNCLDSAIRTLSNKWTDVSALNILLVASLCDFASSELCFSFRNHFSRFSSTCFLIIKFRDIILQLIFLFLIYICPHFKMLKCYSIKFLDGCFFKNVFVTLMHNLRYFPSVYSLTLNSVVSFYFL